MRAYELMVIFSGDLDDSAANGWVKKTEGYATAGGAKISNTDFWGRRKFAYEIDHKTEGYYVVFEIVSDDGSFIDDLDRNLRLADDVVRHKLIRLPDHEGIKRGLLTAA